MADINKFSGAFDSTLYKEATGLTPEVYQSGGIIVGAKLKNSTTLSATDNFTVDAFDIDWAGFKLLDNYVKPAATVLYTYDEYVAEVNPDISQDDFDLLPESDKVKTPAVEGGNKYKNIRYTSEVIDKINSLTQELITAGVIKPEDGGDVDTIAAQIEAAIVNKLDSLDKTVTSEEGLVVVSVEQKDGLLNAVTVTTNNIATADDLTDAIDRVETLENYVESLKTLIGDSENDDEDGVVNKLTEIIKWFEGVQEDGSGAALVQDVAANKSKLEDLDETINGTPAVEAKDAVLFDNVDDYNEAHKDEEGFTPLSSEEFDALSDDKKIKEPAVEGKDATPGLVDAVSDLDNAINGEDGLASKVSDLEEALGDTNSSVDDKISAAIDALDGDDGLSVEEGEYVAGLQIVDGKIELTTRTLPTPAEIPAVEIADDSKDYLEVTGDDESHPHTVGLVFDESGNCALIDAARDGLASQSDLDSLADLVGESDKVFNYTEDEAKAENDTHLVPDGSGLVKGDEGYVPTYEEGYTPVTTDDTYTKSTGLFAKVEELEEKVGDKDVETAIGSALKDLFDNATASQPTGYVTGLSIGEDGKLSVTKSDLPELSVNEGSENYVEVNDHSVGVKTTALGDVNLVKGDDGKWTAPESVTTPTGLATAADVAAEIVANEQVVAAALNDHEDRITDNTEDIESIITAINNHTWWEELGEDKNNSEETPQA